MCYIKKKCKYTWFIFQNVTQPVKNYLNDPKRRKGKLPLSCSKKLTALLKGITSKYNGDFHCLNCLHSFRTGNRLTSHEKVCQNKYFCGIVMPSQNDNIL